MQWKERGLGDIKVLTNADTGKSRMLMRRERILKVCLNQAITKEIKLEDVQGSDKQLTWIAVDPTDEEAEAGKPFQFRVKFISLRRRRCAPSSRQHMRQLSRPRRRGPAFKSNRHRRGTDTVNLFLG